MASTKEIHRKIKSVKSTQKITKAMEIVAVSKMRKSQERMKAARFYAEAVCKVINNLSLSYIRDKHPYLKKRKVNRIGYLVVSTDRGLCGGLNINLFKKLSTEIKIWLERDVEIDLALIGSKAASFFNLKGINIIDETTGISDQPYFFKFMKSAKVLLKNYDANRLDKLYIVNNKFINAMSQEPKVSQILPLLLSNTEEFKKKACDYLYEPDLKTPLDALFRRYVESQVYQGVLENLASEHAARMVAMKSANDNASNLIRELQLIYNKARQTSITQELAEVVVGASLV